MISRKILVIDDQQDVREKLADAIIRSGRKNEATSLIEKMKSRLAGQDTAIESPQLTQNSEIIYEVDTAPEGEEGCELVKKAIAEGHPYNVIFVDMRMPGWDGLKTMVEVFKIDKKVQVVLCTAYADYSWDEINEKVGRRDNLLILKKPFDNMEVSQLALALTEKYYAEDHLFHSQKMETVGALSAGLAHDFNNIISSLQATVSSIEFSLDMESVNTKLKNDLKIDLDTMNEAIKQGADMVQVLLSLSRRQELPFSPVDLNELMNRVIKICSRTLDKSVEIKFKPNERRAVVMAYPIQIEQVLLNLCINADHAMTIMKPDGEKKGGGLVITIEDEVIAHPKRGNIAEIAPGKYWHLSIKDHGIGMTPKTISQIFDPFFTTKAKGVGTGLGLSMVFSIIQKHKGFLDLFSTPGEGSVFSIYLPVLDEEV